ncbi:acetylcholinesterase-like [Amblyomma americanum]
MRPLLKYSLVVFFVKLIDADVLDCLRSKPAEELCDATYNVSAAKVYNFIPSHPNAFFPERPTVAIRSGHLNHVDVMLGITSDEGNFIIVAFPDTRILSENLEDISEDELRKVLRFVAHSWLPDKFAPTLETYVNDTTKADKRTLRELHTAFIGDAQFICPMKFFADDFSGWGNSVYFSVLGYRSAMYPFPKWVGVPHTADIVFYFGVPIMTPEYFTDEDREFTKIVMKAITSFAKTGTPVIDGVEWPAYTPEDPAALWLQPGNYSLHRNIGCRNCDFWKKHLK